MADQNKTDPKAFHPISITTRRGVAISRGQRKRQIYVRGHGGRSAKVPVQGTEHQPTKCYAAVNYAAGTPHSNRMRPTPSIHGLPNKVVTEPLKLTYVTVEDTARTVRGTGQEENDLKSSVQSRQTDTSTRHYGEKGRQTSQGDSPVRGDAVCTTSGKCQAGGELRLSHFLGTNFEIPEGFAVVGAKSPMLQGMTLVALVDKRYLPDEKTNMAMLGFSGNCLGCGAKGFRYFTEFSTHINLRLATQPKKQKHLKYFIIRERSGRLRKGPPIPWRVDGRKRTYPLSGPYVPPAYSETDLPNKCALTSPSSAPPKVTVYPAYVQSTVPQGNGSSEASSKASNRAFTDQSSLHNTDGRPAVEQRPYQQQNSTKRARWESCSSEAATSASSEDPANEEPTSSRATRGSDSSELPTRPWLTIACSVCPVLLLCQHSIPKIPCLVDDIIISDLLVGCFDPPLVSDQTQLSSLCGPFTGEAGSVDTCAQLPYLRTGPCLTSQMAILLLVQYLSQLVEDDHVSREDIESLLQDAKLELSATMQQQCHLVVQSNLVSYLQLPVLANLTAATSKGRVKVVASPVSLDCAIVRALKFVLEIHKHNQTKFPRVPIPDFIFILATPQDKPPEFCILVTSISQAKYLSEAMLGHPVRSRISENLGKLDQIFRLSSDALEQLVSSFEEALGQGQLVFIPFNGFARMKILTGEALSIEPKVNGHSHPLRDVGLIFSTQNLMAKQLVAQVCTIAENSNALNVNQFVRVDLSIVVPPVATLFNQTVKRLHQSGLLTDLGLEGRVASIEKASQFVIKFDETDDTLEKLRGLRDRVQNQPKSLFVLIFDQAQFYSTPKGLDLPYFEDFLDAPNVLPLFVTAAPYLFQTNHSFIDPENEVYWTETRNEAESTNGRDKSSSFQEQEGMYFGIKEYCDSIKWTHQFPLIRQDDAFERMTLRTIRATEDLDLSVMRCYLLTRHYCAAIMWSAGIKPAEPHCTLKTIQIMREIIESPVRNADGSGSMLVIRIPSVELANFTLESLRSTRDRLGFQFRFALIHDNGSRELDVEEYFLKRLRLWKAQRGQLQGKPLETWCPSCFEELQDLPCIVLESGRERTGETFPRSLKYIDLRLIDRGFLYRSSLELEFSAIASYIGTGPGAGVKGSSCEGLDDLPSAECDAAEDAKAESNGGGGTVCRTSHYSSNYPLPVILVSQSAFKAFQTDFYGYPKHLLLTTTPQTRWVGLGRAHLVTSNPEQQSLYYREWTEPKPKLLVGTQCNSVNSRTVISMRSASGIVISPEIADVVEEDGLSAVESLAGSNRQTSGGPTSEAEDNISDDTKPATADVSRGSQDLKQQERRLRNGLSGKQGSLAYRLDRVANGQVRSDSDAGTTDDETEPDRLGRKKYHPRSVLFSGPPQVGKTGTYLHFVRLLNRMLLKLQRVDVYDISSYGPEANCTPNKRVRLDAASTFMWPDYNTVCKLPFSHDTREHKYANISPVVSDTKAGMEVPVDRKPARNCAGTCSTRSSTRSVMLSPWSSYDISHHCDSCKHYREGVGPSASLCYAFKLRSGEVLQFVIPPSCQRYFAFTQDKQLRSMRLPLVFSGGSGESVKCLKKESGEEMEDEIKSPIMMPSTGRHETGLLNLYHALYGAKHVHLVFVKHREVALYHKTWPNHVIVGLPASCDCEGLGVARFFIKEFATENLVAERERQKVNGKVGDVWPFMFMMDDSCVMWQNLLLESMKSGDTKEKDPSPSVNTSLLKILRHLEATPDLMKYGLLGFRQYNSAHTNPNAKGSFSHCTLNTALLMNVSLLQDVQYDRMKYQCEDVDFSLRVQSRGVPSCRFNHLVVVKKYIETGGATTYRLQMNGVRDGAGPLDSANFQKLVTAPDREDGPFFSVPAHYLLELYLARMSASWLFSAAADTPTCPVLLIDCYVNLGPRLTVEFVSTRGPQCASLGERQGRKYGGLLLYLTDSFLTAELLHHYQFLPGARLCLVSQDRNTLRQDVARLDLEERWRFRLRDEFQTANDPDEASLYFLTGTYE